jgi:flagellar FliL protein
MAMLDRVLKVITRTLRTVVGLTAVVLFLLSAVVAIGMVATMVKINPHKKKPGEVPLPGPTVTIKDQVYNLGDSNRYLKAAILLELNTDNKSEKQNQAFLDKVKKRESQIKGLIINEVSRKTFREVNSPQGKEQLKEELRLRINELLAPNELKSIMFTSFAVQ